MAKTVSSLAELDKEARRRIDVALNGEVKNVVEDCMKDHIQRDVFAAYTPKVYERRGDSGIEGEGNIESTVKDGLLTVKNVAKLEGPRVPGYTASTATQTGLAQLLEGQGKGVANIWGSPSSAGYLKPRPFVTNTKRDVASGKAHGQIVRAIKKQFPGN